MLMNDRGNKMEVHYHGGKRPGAGRRSLYPPADGETRRQHPVYCSSKELALIKSLLALCRMGRTDESINDVVRIAVMSEATRPGTTVANIADWIQKHDD